MDMTTITGQLGDFAKDIRINLNRLFDEETDTTNISLQQRLMIALAASYALDEPSLIDTFGPALHEHHPEAVEAAKIAATLMAMNNIYYRSVHFVDDEQFASRPAGLRMAMMASHGIDKADFEAMSLAVSAINGCGHCVAAHAKGLSPDYAEDAIQWVLKATAVLKATSQAIKIGK